MKSFVIALQIILFIFIWSNALPSSNAILFKQKIESYQACIRIRSKILNLNLKCENLLVSIPPKKEFSNKVGINGIKYLSSDIIMTRKVSKNEEIKLRNLIKSFRTKTNKN